MDILHTLFFFLLALAILVTFHEYGHYWVARRCGVKVLKFSVGFGPSAFSWRRGDTEYAIATIPLGGYVKMFGENTTEDDVELTDEEKAVSFSHKSVLQRMAIVAAGPIANFLLAIIIYWLIFLGGTTGLAPVLGSVEEGTPVANAGMVSGLEIKTIDGRQVENWDEVNAALLNRLGDTGEIQVEASTWQSDSSTKLYFIEIENWLASTGEPDVIGSLGFELFGRDILVREVSLESAAAKAGFLVGDRIVSLDGVPTAGVPRWIEQVKNSADQTLEVGVQRQGVFLTLLLTPDEVEEGGAVFGRAGVTISAADWPEEMIRDVNFSVISALRKSLSSTAQATELVAGSLIKMVTGKISTQNIGGPITIAKVAGDTADLGWHYYMKLLAILSISLAVLNLLPIPMLDGGHLMFYIVEFFKGSPVGEKVQAAGFRVGLVLLVGIMLLALYNDLGRLLSSPF